MILQSLNLLLLVIIFISFHMVNKSIKNIWQKKCILYNQVYKDLICYYYNDGIKKDLLKEELVYYYNNIILNKSLDEKYKKFMEVKDFISKLLWNKVRDNIQNIELLLKYYLSLQRLLYLFIFISILLITSLFIIYYI